MADSPYNALLGAMHEHNRDSAFVEAWDCLAAYIHKYDEHHRKKIR